MRQPQRWIILVLLALSIGVGGRASADDRSDAKGHYQAGVKFYGSGDYRAAIKEFSSAQQLVPADLNNYNLALCYDKLGDAEPAIQYYREYLNKVPGSDKRAEIEASIARLDSALKSVSQKKVDEQKKLDDARKAEDARKAADDAKKAEEAKKIEDAKKASEDTKKVPTPTPMPPTPPAPALGSTGAGPSTGVGGNGNSNGNGMGSTGTPGSGQIVSTGDAQLDRVQGIDINAVRDRNYSSDPRSPQSNVGVQGAGGPQPNGMAGAPPSPQGQGPQAANGQAGQPDDKSAPKETPVYKKWWFWAVVAVSAYVVYEIATQSSASPNTRAREDTMLPPIGRTTGPSAGAGLTWHF